MIQYPVERVWLAAPPGRNGWKYQALAKQMLGKTGKKWHDRRRLNQAAPQCIGNDDVSSHDGVDQARHAEQRLAAQFERIAEAVIHSAQNYVDALQSIYCLEVDGPVTHGEVRSGHQSESKVSSDVRVFEIGFVVGTGGEKNNA